MRKWAAVVSSGSTRRLNRVCTPEGDQDGAERLPRRKTGRLRTSRTRLLLSSRDPTAAGSRVRLGSGMTRGGAKMTTMLTALTACFDHNDGASVVGSTFLCDGCLPFLPRTGAV